MCVVSNVGDYGRQTIPNAYPWIPAAGWPNHLPPTAPSRAEFEALKQEVQELRKLLEAAKAYDDATGQTECHMEDKVAFLKQVAEFVGVDLGDVFGTHK